MNWDMIGALGEIAGAVAVVGSLVYLAQQIRFSNRLAQAEAWRQPISDINGLNATFGMDPQFRDAVFMIGEGATPDDMTQDQAQLVEIYVVSVFNCIEQLFREMRSGVLAEETFATFPFEGLFALPFTRTRWEAMRQRLGPDFVKFVEGRFDMRVDSGQVGAPPTESITS